jgi:hypothetical protein
MNTIRIFFSLVLLFASNSVRAQQAQLASYKKGLYEGTMAELKSAKDEYSRWCLLGDAAKASLDQGHDPDARSFAEELERLAPKYKKDWNYGNAIQDFNIVKGRLALKAGDVEAAKKRLLAAGHTSGSPQLNTFGPDMSLAKELLGKNEKAVVLEYFALCGKFWEMEEGRLAYWKKEVQQNRIPDFDAAPGTIAGKERAPSKAAEGGPELVMKAGMKITAETKTGVISVSAGKGLNRTYAWEGASRSSKLEARTERWYGSLGAYDGAPGEPWAEHHGVTRGVVEEGQQHFESEKEAMAWLRKQAGYYPTVYRDDGLVVSFGKVLERRQINVEVWQIFIHGTKPKKLPGSDNSKIKVPDEKGQ